MNSFWQFEKYRFEEWLYSLPLLVVFLVGYYFWLKREERKRQTRHVLPHAVQPTKPFPPMMSHEDFIKHYRRQQR